MTAKPRQLNVKSHLISNGVLTSQDAKRGSALHGLLEITEQREALQNEVSMLHGVIRDNVTEKNSIIDGVKRDLQAVLDHPEWSLARIRMHLESIIQEKL